MCRSLHKKSIILDTMRTGSDWPVMSGNRKGSSQYPPPAKAEVLIRIWTITAFTRT
jgi:hypothetical protein